MSDAPRGTHGDGETPRRGRAAGASRGPALGLAVVRGRSMEPTLAEGQRLLVSYRRARRARVRPGDVVVARFGDGTVAVKRAVERRPTISGGTGWWLLSDNPGEGVDSRHRGAVPETDVVAVAVARVWPRPRLLRRGRPSPAPTSPEHG